uniref:L1 transposable element RRM domain-containing protein n=1 Tax=Sphaeramia orbicularis TaxID=375764 RepID=A0A673AMF5_9TELE
VEVMEQNRQKHTSSPKIDQMLSSQPHDYEANAVQASTSMEKPGETDSSVINEIRNMKRELQDKIQLVGTDVTTIKMNLDSLKTDVAYLGNRIGETENRVSQLEDENVQLAQVTSELKNKVAQLEARMQYQENYSRRNNLRIKGVPEHIDKEKSVTECVKDILRTLLPNEEDLNQIVIKRAHRIPTALKKDRQLIPFGPRHILVRFLRFSEREKIRLRARDLGTFNWIGNKDDFFPDFTKEVQDKRNKFTEVRRMCRAKELKYTLQYPAALKKLKR